MSFINLSNLKESQSLPDPGTLEYINSKQKSSGQNPVYIKTNATTFGQPKFIPNIGGFQQ